MNTLNITRSVIASLACIALVFLSLSANADTPSVEERRIDKARAAMPKVVDRMQTLTDESVGILQAAESPQALSDLAHLLGSRLWRDARNNLPDASIPDDRSLYWSRLLLTRFLRSHEFVFELDASERLNAIEQLEEASRGRSDLVYKDNDEKRILLTGFDPFLLDRNIEQSNPSGVIALRLDNKVITHKRVNARVNTVVFPVRYGDFDAGEVEALLAPVYALEQVDMVVTVSMGRDQFDLERFPGRRRSAEAPGNLNVYSGAFAGNPMVPLLYRAPLVGPEFVEISLPVAVMQGARGDYVIRDRHWVTTLEKSFEPSTLSQLRGAIAVEGGGGGYLSNEISYRSIRLRNLMGSTIPTGHIHTPRISRFDPDEIDKIATQVEQMLKLALPAI
jgi:pyrrolidone-carboxylate peptidase